MLIRLVILSLLSIFPLIGHSANIVINPITGFSDATPTAAIGGNPGTTLGAQRLNTFQKAADILETFLDIKVDVKVDAAFSGLVCSAGSGVLGSAGAVSGHINTANVPLANTIYPIALVNNLANSDINSATAEISATFNSSMDNNDNCLAGVDWYYGYDDPSLAGAEYVNDTSFLSVVIHELLHGLGVSSWVSASGALNSGFMDAYSANLYDQSTNKSWAAMNNSERSASMTNSNNLVWTGTNVNSSTAASLLTNGINSGNVEMYAPNPYESGSSVSHFSKDATPNEIMEPTYTEFLTTPGMATQLLQDMGWALVSGNTAPILASIGSQSTNEDNAKVLALSATDGEGDSLTYSAVSDNASVTASVLGSNLTLTPAANYFGSANITVTVSDGALSDSEVIILTVNSDNDLPVFTSSASDSVQYGNSLDVILSATDIETADNSITFAVQNSNASQVTATILGTTLSLTPVNNYIGDTTITIRATDGNSGSTDQNFVLTSTAIPNTAPVLAVIGAQSIDEDNAKIIALSASDGEGNSLTYSASSDNASVSTSVSGSSLTLTPAANYFGSANITVTVSDGALSDSEVIALTVNSDNDLPLFTSLASGSVQYGNSLDVTLSATDIETANNSITFSVQNSNASQVTASISGTTLSLTPVNDYLGNTTITLRATDGDSGITDQSFVLTSTAIPNTAPVLAVIGAQSTDEDNAKVLALSATDGEGNSLTYSASSDNASVAASVSGSTLTLTPAANYFGNANITVSVSDGALSDSEVMVLTVNSDNDLPQFTSSSSGSIVYGNSFDITLSATDIETADNSITFAVQNSNTSQVTASISGSTLSLTPVNNYLGNTTITLRATDGDSGITDQSFVLTTTATANTAPALAAIGAQSTDEDNAKVIALSATDSEDDSLTYSASSDNGSITASVSANSLTLTPATNYFGNANITVTVSDGTLTDSEVVVLTVNSDNDLPLFTSSDSGSVQYGNSLDVILNATDIETANDSITFAVQSSNASQVTASISGTTLSLTPVNDYLGDTTITLRASDGDSGHTDQNYVLTSTAIPNTAPIFNSASQFSSLYSNTLPITLVATDGENDSLSYTLVNANNNQVNALISDNTLTLQAVNNFIGATSLMVSASDGELSTEQQINIVIYEDFNLSSANVELNDGGLTNIKLDEFTFNLTGGNQQHSVSVMYDGQAVDASLLTEIDGQYQLAMPNSGAFAGSYEVVVTDDNGESASFTLQRPLRLTTNINQLISTSNQQKLFIEGAPANSTLDLYLTQENNELSLQKDGLEITQLNSADDSATFNRTVVELNVTSSSLASIATLAADGVNLPRSELEVQLLPMHAVSINISNSNGTGIQADIDIQDERFAIWGLEQQLTSNAAGQLTISLATDIETELSIRAINYQTKAVVALIEDAELLVELELLENPMTVSGRVTTSTLNFIEQAPLIRLVATDGSITDGMLNNIRSGSTEYSITVNKFVFDVEKLSIIHGDIQQDVHLSNNQTDTTVNIHIDSVQVTAPREQELPAEEEVIEVSPTSVGNGFILVLISLMLLFSRKRILGQQIAH